MVWKGLRHPNVLPLLGVTVTENRFVMVSEWMEKGNIGEFLKADTNADRFGLVCFRSWSLLLTLTLLLQLKGITRGLIYMHDQ